MTRTLLALLFLITALIGCGKDSTGPAVESRTGIFFDPEQTELAVGAGTDLALKIEGLTTPIFAVSLQIAYNDAITDYDNSAAVQNGDFFGATAIQFAQAADSKLHVTISRTQGEASVSGSNTLCRLHFNAVAAGHDTLRILPEQLHFFNAEGNELSITAFAAGTASVNVH